MPIVRPYFMYIAVTLVTVLVERPVTLPVHHKLIFQNLSDLLLHHSVALLALLVLHNPSLRQALYIPLSDALLR